MEPMLKTADVLQLLGVSRPTLTKYCRLGIFPKPLKLMGVLRWQAEVVEDWITSGGAKSLERCNRAEELRNEAEQQGIAAAFGAHVLLPPDPEPQEPGETLGSSKDIMTEKGQPQLN